MYYYISGKKALVGGGFAVIDCGGVGYRLFISDRTAGRLNADTSGDAKLFTYLNVKEDALELYGFYSEEEQRSFRLLISVSGVGPKAALAILSVMTPERLALCVLSEDAKGISEAQGVGLKTAQKIILEIKDKISKDKTYKQITACDFAPTMSIPDSGAAAEAADALVVLGYSRTQALNAISKTDCAGRSVEEIIKYALKLIAQ